jgi:hypothetical protein
MSWFTKFDSWVKSIGDKTIKPVAEVAVYATSALLGVPAAGKAINTAWQNQEEQAAQVNAQNLSIAQSAQAAAAAQSSPAGTTTNIFGSISGSWWFIGFLILLYIISRKKKTK